MEALIIFVVGVLVLAALIWRHHSRPVKHDYTTSFGTKVEDEVGLNDDEKAALARAHSLGVKIYADITGVSRRKLEKLVKKRLKIIKLTDVIPGGARGRTKVEDGVIYLEIDRNTRSWIRVMPHEDGHLIRFWLHDHEGMFTRIWNMLRGKDDKKDLRPMAVQHHEYFAETGLENAWGSIDKTIG